MAMSTQSSEIRGAPTGAKAAISKLSLPLANPMAVSVSFTSGLITHLWRFETYQFKEMRILDLDIDYELRY